MWNDYAAEQIRNYPGRYGLFAVVPLPDTEGSLAEIEYALDTLKADGIGLLSSYDGKYLGDASFAPVFAELNRRKAIVYTHPTTSACCSSVSPAVTAAGDRISVRDHAHHHQHPGQRHRRSTIPDIRLIFSHGGGATPMLAGRMVGDPRPPSQRRQSDAERRFGANCASFITTPPAPIRPAAMAALRVMAPTNHILFGTDYPFVKVAAGVKHMQERTPMSEADRAAIDRGNAIALLPRLGAS